MADAGKKMGGGAGGKGPQQRDEQAMGKEKTDDLMESFEKLDKDVRAEKDLGKGNRSGK